MHAIVMVHKMQRLALITNANQQQRRSISGEASGQPAAAATAVVSSSTTDTNSTEDQKGLGRHFCPFLRKPNIDVGVFFACIVLTTTQLHTKIRLGCEGACGGKRKIMLSKTG